MLYVIGYPESETNWTGTFMRALRKELLRLSVPFAELPPFDWRGPAAPLGTYLNVKSTPDDHWFLGWAHSPLIELLQQKKGQKFGLAVGMLANHFDPIIFTGQAEAMREKERLGLYDGIFAVSRFCRECLVDAYPSLENKVHYTGFPVDFGEYASYQGIKKESGLVVFNQRFALERLPVLELEVAKILSSRGFRVQHLSGATLDKLNRRSPWLSAILSEAGACGLEFVHNRTKDEYCRSLAKASAVVTTSIADTFSVAMVEAICLGVIPAAPAAFCFPEYVHADNLYTPYDFDEIMNIVLQRPQRHHRIAQFSAERVVGRMVAQIGL